MEGKSREQNETTDTRVRKMSVKLEYFQSSGLAEPIRYILHYNKQQFEDIRYGYEEWPVKSVKDTLLFGQLPAYYEGDRTLTQSFAIARYLAHKADLIPSDIWEQAQLDSAALNIYEYNSKVIAPLYESDPGRKKEMQEKVLNEAVDFYFSRFEKQLEANNGYFGKKLSWVDFLLAGFLELSFVIYGDSVYQKYTNVYALYKKVTSLPGVKEYVTSRKPYKNNFD